MNNYKILVIEDDDLMQTMIQESLTKLGYQVITSNDGLDGWNKFQRMDFPLVIIDLKLPKLTGTTLLRKIKEISPETVIIMMTAFGTVESAVEAMKLGAYDYITKPFLIEELILLIEKGLELRNLKRENILLKKELDKKYSLGNIIGKSKVMQKIYNLVENIAPLKSTVLIKGESGTGKELIAETIHHLSTRKNKPLIKVSCAALAETLLESELFGHERGAFTGAVKRKIGRFELAQEGTLFLDDIDDMNQEIQVKLLRVLQEKEFERVGGTETIKVNVRLIASTKRDLKEQITTGNFREDLYYRLNVIPVIIPPLRERIEDIPLLSKHFLQIYNTELAKKVSITPETIQLMMSYQWPGNIRELENLIERMIAVSTNNTIQASDLPPYFREKKKWKITTLKIAAQEAEKEHIEKVLEATAYNKKEAAKILGISTKTLWQKIKEYEIK